LTRGAIRSRMLRMEKHQGNRCGPGRPLLALAIACGIGLAASCASRPAWVPSAEEKYHPGHYVCVGRRTGLEEISDLDEPALQGLVKRYFWRDLEPHQGVYDFTEIESDLTGLEALGKRLIVFAMDMSYSAESALPPYLARLEIRPAPNDHCPVRWHPLMVERFIALGKAIGAAFDDRWNFEGLAMQESALSIDEEAIEVFGYSPENYSQALIDILLAWKGALPRSRVFWYSNFLYGGKRYLYRVADALVGSGVAMGGPDILPYNSSLAEWSYPMYPAYAGRLPLFCSAQGDSYKHHKNDTMVGVIEPVHAEGYLSMEDIFSFARENLRVDYMFWDYETQADLPGQHTYQDALEVMRRYPDF